MFEIACKLKIQLSALEVLLRDFLAAGAREGEQFLHTVSPYSPSALQNMQHFCLHFMQRCEVVEQRQLERGEERGEERSGRTAGTSSFLLRLLLGLGGGGMAAASDLEVEDLAEEDLAEVDLEEDLAGTVEVGGMELNLGGLPFLFVRRGSGACRSAPEVTVAEGTFLALNLSVFSLALPSVSTMDALKGRDVAWYLSASLGKLSTLFLEDFSMFFGILASMNLQYRILSASIYR